MKGLVQILILASLFCWSTRADDDIPKPQLDKPTVAILILRNATGDTNHGHWQKSLTSILKSQLAEVKSIRILPDSSREYAYHQLKLEPEQLPEPAQVEKMGRIMGAQKVAWGEFQRTGKDWKLLLQVMTVSEGKPSDRLTFASPELSQACLGMSRKLLSEMDIHPTPIEEKKMSVHYNTSNEALELTSRGYHNSELGTPTTTVQEMWRRALAIDPNFVEVRRLLAHACALDGKLDESKTILKDLIKIRPDSASAHVLLGLVYNMQDLPYSGRLELMEAVRLGPDDPDNYFNLSRVYRDLKKYDQAIEILQMAISLAPYDPSIHAKMAVNYIDLMQPAKALLALSKAVIYQTEENIDREIELADAYNTLNEIPKAVEHYEKFLSKARQRGIKTAGVEKIEAVLPILKARLKPHFVQAPIPQVFTPEELEHAVKAKLTPEEYKLIINPLADTPAMKDWAKSLVGDASSDQEKAYRLFYGLTRHIDVDNKNNLRTAEQTFNDWSNPKVNFVCQEYTLLYMVLARHVGLKAFYVWVDKDNRGIFVPHACAGVFVGEKALLIDPNYRWFGIPHEKFYFKNDLEVVALYLSQLSDVARGNVAVKLTPDSSYVYFMQAMNLADTEQTAAARQVLEQGLAIDSTSWLALFAQGTIELQSKNWNQAVKYLKQCLDLNPGFPTVHYCLGGALAESGDLKEAVDEFRKYLAAEPKGENAANALEALSKIDESLKAQAKQTEQ